MLEAGNISFGFDKENPVIKNLSIQLPPGRVIALFGKSGSGKTTLARLLAGYLEPDQGTVSADTRPLPAKGYCPVQLVFQHAEAAMNPRMKISAIVNEGQPVDEELIEILKISRTWFDRYPCELSNGELQRIALARALGRETRYLITDEMTSMLDSIIQAQLWHSLLDIVKKRAIGLLAISHDLKLLKKLTDHIIEMPAGS